MEKIPQYFGVNLGRQVRSPTKSVISIVKRNKGASLL